MKLAIIAGNGRFPFLVLDAARSLGHDITIIGIKEEASKELEAAAARPPKADLHWVSIGHLGTFLKILKDAAITTAVMAGQVKHVKIFGFVPDHDGHGADGAVAVAEHRLADWRRGGPDARARRRALELRDSFSNHCWRARAS